MLLDDDTALIGTPGPYTWRGTVFAVSVSDDFLHRDKTLYYGPLTQDHSPVDKYSYLGMAIFFFFILFYSPYVCCFGLFALLGINTVGRPLQLLPWTDRGTDRVALKKTGENKASIAQWDDDSINSCHLLYTSCRLIALGF
jgi:hypothetical protein